MLKLLLVTPLAFTSEAAVLMPKKIDISSSAFDDYILKYNRSYEAGSEEYFLRKDIFQQRLAQIKAHNANPAKLWTAGLSSITDLTDGEFKQKLGWRRTKTRTSSSLMQRQNLSNSPTPIILEEMTPDWTTLVMASKVPDQGACGSCWAVASMSLLQGRFESQLKRHRTFSAQELVNCVPNPKECGGQGGCQGATVELAMEYVEKQGLQEEHSIPYRGSDGSCSASSSRLLDIASERSLIRRRGDNEFKLAHWEKLPENRAEPLMRAAVEGPVAVSVGADAWGLYSGGVFDGCDKDVVINHAVTLFGYGKTSNAKYWNIRNSWGAHWGENGYIRLLRKDTMKEEENLCGVDHDPGQGVECKPYPEKVTVCGMCGVLYDSVAVQFLESSSSPVAKTAQPEEQNADVGIGPIR